MKKPCSLRITYQHYKSVSGCKCFSNANANYEKEKVQATNWKKTFIESKSILSFEYLQANTELTLFKNEHNVQIMSVIKIRQFFFSWLLSWKHFDKCKICLASKFKPLLPVTKLK